jgi:predicted TIM-barrel fold metal-dependent hydrolase
VLGRIEPGLTDADASLLLADLNTAGIDTGAMIQLDFGVAVGEAQVSPEAVIEHLLALQDAHFPKLLAFVGIDPRRPDAERITRRAVESGARGVKLYPPAGYYPGDDACQPIYRICCERGLPVMFHTAFIGYPMQPRFANPMLVCDVQRAFPELRMILGHAGHPVWREEAILVAERHPWTWLELSQWDRDMSAHPEELKRWIRHATHAVGANRILFASDHQSGPRMSGSRSRIPAWASFIRGLAEPAHDAASVLSKEDVDFIMGGAASELMGLPPSA